MSRDEAITVLDQAGFMVEPRGMEWSIVPPPGTPAAELQPGGAVLPERLMIAVAKVIKQRMSPAYRLMEASRWN
jgi:hypothetical protein